MEMIDFILAVILVIGWGLSLAFMYMLGCFNGAMSAQKQIGDVGINLMASGEKIVSYLKRGKNE